MPDRERRIADLERRIADLERRIADLQAYQQDELLRFWARLHDELSIEREELQARLRASR